MLCWFSRNPSLKFKNVNSVEQTCLGLTNGDSLSIEWYGPNGRVSNFLILKTLRSMLGSKKRFNLLQKVFF